MICSECNDIGELINFTSRQPCPKCNVKGITIEKLILNNTIIEPNSELIFKSFNLKINCFSILYNNRKFDFPIMFLSKVNFNKG